MPSFARVGISLSEKPSSVGKKPFEDLGYAKVDLHRDIRQGAAEVIYGAGKSPDQIRGIIERLGIVKMILLGIAAAAVAVVCGSCAKKEEPAYEKGKVSYTVVNNTGKNVTEIDYDEQAMLKPAPDAPDGPPCEVHLLTKKDPETGEELPDGKDGEFCSRGYNIMKGYYKMPDATAAAIDRDGWLHSGDLARRNPDGTFLITGRLKDMIIRGGENIYPKEIEEFIYTHPDVEDVQVIGVPDAKYGEAVMACIIRKEGSTLTEKEMSDYIRSHMARHKVPSYIEFTDHFPLNAAGKVLKYTMREEAAKRLGLVGAAGIDTAGGVKQ